MSSSYTNIFGGGLIQPSYSFYSAIILTSNITLAWSTDFGNNPLVVSSIMDISPSNNGYTVTMPPATNISVGFTFAINNITSYSFTLLGNDGITVISVINPASFNEFYLTDNTSINGNWRLIPGLGGSAVTSIGLNTTGLASGNIIVNSSTTNPITLAGTFSLGLEGDLGGITNLGNTTGFLVRTAVGEWQTESILGTNNQITVTNGDGVEASPSISLASAISGIDSIALVGGNLQLGVIPNTINAINPNGGVTISSVGSGNVELLAPVSGSIFLIPSDGNITLSPTIGSIVFSLTSPGFVGCNANIVLSSQGGVQSGIVFQDSNNSNNIKFSSPQTISDNYTIQLPGAIPAETQVLGVFSVVDSVVNMDWISVPNATETTVVNTIPYSTSTVGGIASTTITVTGGNPPTGLNIQGALQVGNISMSGNTVTTQSGSILLSPASPGTIDIETGTLFRFLSGSDYYALTIPNLSSNYTLTLPNNNVSSGGVFVTNGGNPSAVGSWTNALTNLTSAAFGSGNIIISGSGNSILTSGSNALALGTNSINAITIDTSQNVTIANDLTISTGEITVSSGTVTATGFDTGSIIISGSGNSISTSGTNVLTLGTSGAADLILKTNGSSAITIDTSQNVTIAGNLSTNPGNSVDVTTPFISAFTGGTAYQNTVGCDIMLTVYFNVSMSGSVIFGTAKTALTSGQTMALPIGFTGVFTMSFYIPKNYYDYVSFTAPAAATVMSAQATLI